MNVKLWIAALLVLLVGFFLYHDRSMAKADQSHVQQANLDQAGAHSEAAAGTAELKPMQEQRAQVGRDGAANQGINATLAQDRARLAKYRPAPVPDPGAPTMPTAEVGEGVESPRELAKDQLDQRPDHGARRA